MDDKEKDEALVRQQTKIADLSNTVMLLSAQVRVRDRDIDTLRHRNAAEFDGFKNGVSFVTRLLIEKLLDERGRSDDDD